MNGHVNFIFVAQNLRFIQNCVTVYTRLKEILLSFSRNPRI